jgi:tripartite-type tricarboxylate transporter receptor subunit TctC
MKIVAAVAFACLLGLFALGDAHAQAGYPDKPIRFVSPFPPGGAADTLARALAQKIGELYERQALVENRTGAGGTIGTDFVAKAAPDGYTLLLGNVSTLAIAPSLYTKLGYDPNRDFTPVTLVGKSPLVFGVNPTVPARSLKELVALARSHPTKLTFGSSGAGSITHLTGELLGAAAKVKLLHVPYKGSPPVLTALVSGEIDIGVLQVVELLPFHRAGRIRPLAVSGSARVPVIADVPTAAELGFSGLEATTWYCVVAPRGVPKAVVDALQPMLAKAIGSTDVVGRFAKEGLAMQASTPDALAQLIRADVARWAEVVKRTGVKLD